MKSFLKRYEELDGRLSITFPHKERWNQLRFRVNGDKDILIAQGGIIPFFLRELGLFLPDEGPNFIDLDMLPL